MALARRDSQQMSDHFGPRFFSARFLLAIEGTGNRQWLTRARSDLKYRVIEKFARVDELAELARFRSV